MLRMMQVVETGRSASQSGDSNAIRRRKCQQSYSLIQRSVNGGRRGAGGGWGWGDLRPSFHEAGLGSKSNGQ